MKYAICMCIYDLQTKFHLRTENHTFSFQSTVIFYCTNKHCLDGKIVFFEKYYNIKC
jgi:hypothetical protein